MGGPFTHGLSLMDVYRARGRIAGSAHRTPLLPSSALARRTGAPVHLKLENQQLTGSFKLRGALNAVLALSTEQRERGVVTVSTGNHGRAVAHACRMVRVPATVCMSSLVPDNKVSAIEELGARICINGRSQDDAQVEAERLVAEEGLALVPPFDHPDVIAGQGTLGLEMFEQLSEGRTSAGGNPPLQVIVPLSGGGLISGVALALKALDPGTRIIGVSMERGCAMYQCQRAGKWVAVEEQGTLADSLGGGIGETNRYTYGMVRELVDELVLVDEEQIAAGIVHAYRFERQVVEGAGAVGIAALLAGTVGAEADDGGRYETIVLLSGANIDMEVHRRLVNESRSVSIGAGEPARNGGD